MRLLMTAAVLMLMVGAALAQDAGEQSTTREFTTPQMARPVVDPQINLQRYEPEPRIQLDPKMSVLPQDDRCFFIRSYNFTREDGNAPELKGVTTCTKAKANVMRRTKKSGAKVVPLGW